MTNPIATGIVAALKLLETAGSVYLPAFQKLAENLRTQLSITIERAAALKQIEAACKAIAASPVAVSLQSITFASFSIGVSTLASHEMN